MLTKTSLNFHLVLHIFQALEFFNVIYIYICLRVKCFYGQNYNELTLPIAPFVFLGVVVFVTTGIGNVIWLISYFLNFFESLKSCVEGIHCDPKNIKA